MIVGCSAKTLHSHCKTDHGCTLKEYMGRFKGLGVMSLRRKQMQMALEGNVTMLRWLGIQHLRQSPHVVLLHKVPTGSENQPDQPATDDPEGFEIDGFNDMDGSTPPDTGNVTPGNSKTHALTHQGKTSESDGSVVDAEIVEDAD